MQIRNSETNLEKSFSNSEIKMALNFLFRALIKSNPKVCRDIVDGTTTLEKEIRFARLNCDPLPPEIAEIR
jgi:hypothetical protein